MDPISQAALGAAAAQSLSRPEHVLRAGVLGALAGMAPDLDVLIRSSEDPLLFLEYHRQFTHSLFFVPIGALACALVLRPLVARDLSWRTVYLYCLFGFATHGLLDGCTSYGTQLLWPFTELRVAWNNVSIIDPLFTLPLAGIALLAAKTGRPGRARIAFAWAIAYLLLGVVQRERVESVGLALAERRGHAPARVDAKPAFGSLLLWKTIYETDGRFHVDAVHLVLRPTIYEGERRERLSIPRDLPWLDPESQQARSLERFRWFSSDALALDARRPDTVIDLRYSMLPNRIDPLWALELDPTAAAAAHPAFVTFRKLTPADRRTFFAMLRGADLSADLGAASGGPTSEAEAHRLR
ncbi:MAG: metal-dependent hydrolase [Myxococcota bacterium]